MINPVEGYQNMPLVSLEEAIKPLTKILENVPMKTYIVKQNCEEPSDGLTSDESAAIMLYTMEWIPHESSLYSMLNEALRSEDEEKIKPWFSYLKLFTTALSKLPSFRGTVWRGVRVDMSEHYKEDDIGTWWTLSSVTSDVNILESEHFVGKHGQRTLFQIQCYNGKRIGNHSLYNSDDEILLMPGFHYRVVNVISAGDGLHVINLQQIESPIPLVESL